MLFHPPLPSPLLACRDQIGGCWPEPDEASGEVQVPEVKYIGCFTETDGASGEGQVPEVVAQEEREREEEAAYGGDAEEGNSQRKAIAAGREASSQTDTTYVREAVADKDE